MAEEFKIGDVVKLKSGGPNMTVEVIGEQGVYCAWFDKSEKKEHFQLFRICHRRPEHT